MLPVCQALTHLTHLILTSGGITRLRSFIDVETGGTSCTWKFTESTVRKWCSQHENPSIGKCLWAFYVQDNTSPNTALFHLLHLRHWCQESLVPSRLGLLAHCLWPSDILDKMKRRVSACLSVCLSSAVEVWQEELFNQEVTQEKARALFPLPLLPGLVVAASRFRPSFTFMWSAEFVAVDSRKKQRGYQHFTFVFFQVHSWSREFSKWVEMDPPVLPHLVLDTSLVSSLAYGTEALFWSHSSPTLLTSCEILTESLSFFFCYGHNNLFHRAVLSIKRYYGKCQTHHDLSLNICSISWPSCY